MRQKQTKTETFIAARGPASENQKVLATARAAQDYFYAEQSLRSFIQGSFPILEPMVSFRQSWHIDYVCEYLELVFNGKIQFLVINEPPGHMKSLKATVNFPAWVWMHWPQSRWIFSSYSNPLALNMAIKRRSIIRSNWYQDGWGGRFKMTGDQDSKSFMKNDKEGVWITTSTGGTTGGQHGDFTVADDPQNPEDDESEVARESANAHIEYLITRRRDPKRSRMVLIMQRLHHDDACARLEKWQEKMIMEGVDFGKAHVISLPAESPRRKIYTFPRSKILINGKKKSNKYIRKPGEALWPKHIDLNELNILKERLGPHRYGAQYDQNPTPKGGNIIKSAWWRRWTGIPDAGLSIYSLDTATKAKESNDPTAGLKIVNSLEGGFYLKRFINERIPAAELEEFIADTQASDPADVWIIEDKDSGQRVVQHFQKFLSVPVIGFNPNPYGDKVQRLSRVSPEVAAGRVFLPDTEINPIENVDEFIKQLKEFPKCAHDDFVDAFSMGMLYLKYEHSVGTNTQGAEYYKSRRRTTYFPARSKKGRLW